MTTNLTKNQILCFLHNHNCPANPQSLRISTPTLKQGLSDCKKAGLIVQVNETDYALTEAGRKTAIQVLSLNLTKPQLLILRVLKFSEKPCTAKMIDKWLYQCNTEQGVKYYLKQLETLGYISVKSLKSKHCLRLVNFFALTSQGESILNRYNKQALYDNQL